MAIKMVRKPSETPNINNIDDIIPFRYAYGNQDGYVIGKGTELSHTVNGNVFTVNSGRIVLQGVETDIDANGVSLGIDGSTNELRYYSVYYEVNLATNTVNVLLSNYDVVAYPIIDKGDDLTVNSSGIARLELYRLQVRSGVITNVEKVVKAIEYSGTALVGYDIEKGTVEERLTRLGFREGSVTLAYGVTSTLNILKRQGNYVIGQLSCRISNSSLSGTLFSLPNEFKPIAETNININTGGGVSIYITSSGANYVNVSAGSSWNISISFGYEAEPIE